MEQENLRALASLRKFFMSFALAIRPREEVGGKPAKPVGDVDAAAKERPEEAPFAALRHTAFGCGLGAGDRRRSRHAQIDKHLLLAIIVFRQTSPYI